MAGAFDPYYKWLGIPPKDQPADLYRLLGLERFEPDADVIDAAASKQMAYVRNCASGPHVDLSQKILNELSAARVCLLNPDRKAAYDERLRSELAAREPPGAEEPPVAAVVPEAPAPRQATAVRLAEPVPVISPRPVMPVSVRRVGSPSARRRQVGAYAVAVLLVAMCGLLVALLAAPADREVAHSTEAHPGNSTGVGPGIGPNAGESTHGDAEQPDDRRPDDEGATDGTADEEPGEENISAQGRDGPQVDPPPVAPEPEPASPSEPVIPPLPGDAQQQIEQGMAGAATPADFRRVTVQALHFADLAVLADDAPAVHALLVAAIAAGRKADDPALAGQAALRFTRFQDEGLSNTMKEAAAARLSAGRSYRGGRARPPAPPQGEKPREQRLLGDLLPD